MKLNGRSKLCLYIYVHMSVTVRVKEKEAIDLRARGSREKGWREEPWKALDGGEGGMKVILYLNYIFKGCHYLLLSQSH